MVVLGGAGAVLSLSKRRVAAPFISFRDLRRERIKESERQVEGLFESLLAQSFDGGR
jgi:hypothetical protein